MVIVVVLGLVVVVVLVVVVLVVVVLLVGALRYSLHDNRVFPCVTSTSLISPIECII